MIHPLTTQPELPVSHRSRFVIGVGHLVTVAALSIPLSVPLSVPLGAQGTDPASQPVIDVGTLSGRRIAWVNVVTLPPEPLPGAAAMLDALHVRTQPQVVRRELLFAACDTVDSVRVAESLRRLRRLHYLADVQLASAPAAPSACAGVPHDSAAVGLTVTTRDSWSARANLRLGSGTSGSVVGLEERNLLGTGRSAKVYLRTDYGRLGAGVGYVDPWLFGRDMIGSIRRDVYRDGGAWQAAVRTHARSVFDPWVAEFAVSQRARAAYGPRHRGGAGDTVRRRTAQLLVDRLLAASPFGATRLLFGIEGEQTREIALPTAAVVGPLDVRRAFVGIDIGLARHTTQYEVNRWLLPQPKGADLSAIADIPHGAEGELVTAVGRDFLTGGPAVRLDVGFPVLHSSGVSSRPFVAVSVSPWLGSGRQRDGRGGN